MPIVRSVSVFGEHNCVKPRDTRQYLFRVTPSSWPQPKKGKDGKVSWMTPRLDGLCVCACVCMYVCLCMYVHVIRALLSPPCMPPCSCPLSFPDAAVLLCSSWQGQSHMVVCLRREGKNTDTSAVATGEAVGVLVWCGCGMWV